MPVEEISDSDELNRLFFRIPDKVDPESHFLFTFDKERIERAESVFWRKYASDVAEIHTRGCDLEAYRNEQRPGKGLEPVRYLGTRSITAMEVRDVKGDRGHSLDAIHFPENGDCAHSHIVIRPVVGCAVKNVKTNDIRELVSKLYMRFSQLSSHDCDAMAPEV
jgi:hypothetical protein